MESVLSKSSKQTPDWMKPKKIEGNPIHKEKPGTANFVDVLLGVFFASILAMILVL